MFNAALPPCTQCGQGLDKGGAGKGKEEEEEEEVEEKGCLSVRRLRKCTTHCIGIFAIANDCSRAGLGELQRNR